MEALTNLTYRHSPLAPSLHHHRPSISTTFPSLSFRPPPSSSPPFKSIKASSSSSFSFSKFLLPNPKTAKSQPFQSLIPPRNPKIPKSEPFETLISPPSPILKTALIAAVTSAAVFFLRFNLRPALAAPLPATVEPAADEEQRDREKHTNSNPNPNDVESLRNLMELRLKNKQIPEAMETLDELIQSEPKDLEWRLLKCHMHFYNEELELAKLGFNEIISEDPLQVEAYHGLLMVASLSDSSTELEEIMKKIDKGMELAEGEKLRDFKLLYAQVRVIEGDYAVAMTVYDELLKENPKDFRPYLCQGIIFMLLKDTKEAEKCFKMYRDLIPKDHPYAEHFDEHMSATKLFMQKLENENKKSKR